MDERPTFGHPLGSALALLSLGIPLLRLGGAVATLAGGVLVVWGLASLAAIPRVGASHGSP
ncbi:MAG: hypothetical protein IRY97_08900 [Thermomicrobiaceae bacterium]|nr:hypothetical protein [Thermomicrobiaceae bacterium]